MSHSALQMRIGFSTAILQVHNYTASFFFAVVCCMKRNGCLSIIIFLSFVGRILLTISMSCYLMALALLNTAFENTWARWTSTQTASKWGTPWYAHCSTAFLNLLLHRVITDLISYNMWVILPIAIYSRSKLVQQQHMLRCWWME